MIILECSNGFTLEADDAQVTVVSGRKRETYPYVNIQSIHFAEPGLMYGEIGFKTAEAATSSIHLGFGVSTAVGAERKFFYRKADREKALQVKGLIEKGRTAPATGNSFSVADEIYKLKALLDEGLLTREEFDAQKKKLLG